MREKTNKELTTELQRGANQLLTPMVRPVAKTRMELVNLKAKELEEGRITAYDFAQELKLSDQEYKYAEIFSSVDHLGNGEEAAIEAFDIESGPKQLPRARAITKRMGKHQGVITLINALLSSQGWNEPAIRKQHLFLKPSRKIGQLSFVQFCKFKLFNYEKKKLHRKQNPFDHQAV